MQKRRPNRRQLNNNSPFAARIICGECGGFYGSKVWHSAGKYRTNIWQCNRKYKNGTFCDTPHIREDELKLAFVQAFNRILGDKEHYIAQFEEVLPLLADTSSLEKKLDRAQAESESAMEQMSRYVEDNARQIQNQEEYEHRFNEMNEEYKETKNRIENIKAQISERSTRKGNIRRFLGELRQTGGIISEFDENLWNATVDRITIKSEKELTVIFRDGTGIEVEIPKNP